MTSLRPRRMALLPLLAGFFLAGCSFFEDSGLDDGLEPVGDLIFSVHHEHRPAVEISEGEWWPEFNKWSVGVATEKIYPSICGLAAEITMSGSTVRMTVHGRTTPTTEGVVCLGAVGRSSAGQFFDLSDGTYEFELLHLGHIDRYRFTIEGTSVVHVETLSASVSRYKEYRPWED
jgi:hypothetical protein